MNTCESARIEKTTLDIRGEDVNHGIVCSPVSGDTTIVDTTITHETSGGYPLWIQDSDSSGRVLAEYLTIDGQAGEDGGFRDGIRCERDTTAGSTSSTSSNRVAPVWTGTRSSTRART